MSAKPAAPPAIWGSDPGANLVEPGVSQRELGFTVGQRVYDGHLNTVLRYHDLIGEYVRDGVFTPSIKSPAYLTDTITPLVIGAAQFEHQYPITAGALRGAASWTRFTNLFAWLPLTARQRVRTVSVRCASNGAVGTANVGLYRHDDTADTGALIPGSGITIPNGGSGSIVTLSSGAIDYTIPSTVDTHLLLVLTMAVNNEITLYRAVVTWDRPVV